jgi:Fe-S oxidoreductase
MLLNKQDTRRVRKDDLMVEFTEPAMRPPQEAKSLLLRVTQGCTHNKCSFCYISRGHHMRAVSLEQLENELVAQKTRFPSDTRVYLVGSNPLALPEIALAEYLSLVRKHFPGFTDLGMHARITDIKRKTGEQLADLHQAGLTHLYIGTESGNDEALRIMNKGNTGREAVEQLLRLDEAGIGYVVFYILGLGGHGQGRAGATATADMFNQVHPRRITTTGLTVFPNTPLYEMTRTGEFTEATEREKVEELLVFLEHLTTATFFDSVHYLNPLCYRFDTTQGKESVLEDIRDFLATHTEEDIEKMVARKLMTSL